MPFQKLTNVTRGWYFGKFWNMFAVPKYVPLETTLFPILTANTLILNWEGMVNIFIILERWGSFMRLPVQRNLNIFLLSVLPEGPSIIISCSIKNFNISTRYTANRPVPTVPYSCVKVSCVETFKICIKRDKTLKQKRRQIHWCHRGDIWAIKRPLKF